jgi:hypothetical protein
MPSIVLIDDKRDNRESINVIISNYLSAHYPSWNCMNVFPFQKMEEYISWIIENDVAILVIDEQLHAEPSIEGWHVNYDGHNLVELLRKTFPTFPVYAITAFSVTEALKKRFHLFDDILEHKKFYNNIECTIDRFVRAGQRFSESNINELNTLSEISMSLALGNSITDKKLLEAKAIQERLGIISSVENLFDRSALIERLELCINGFGKLTSEIDTFLKNELEKNT